MSDIKDSYIPTVRVGSDARDHLEQLARNADRTVSDYVRLIILAHLATHPLDNVTHRVTIEKLEAA